MASCWMSLLMTKTWLMIAVCLQSLHMTAVQEWQEEILVQWENNIVTHNKPWIGSLIGRVRVQILTIMLSQQPSVMIKQNQQSNKHQLISAQVSTTGEYKLLCLLKIRVNLRQTSHKLHSEHHLVEITGLTSVILCAIQNLRLIFKINLNSLQQYCLRKQKKLLNKTKKMK